IHLEDGSFTLFWVLAWWIIALVLIGIILFWLRLVKKTDNRMITIAAFCTAASFAIFQVSIPIAGGVHMNLTPLIGILTGPFVGGLIIFIVNILSAAIGHGGWGMIGANTLVNATEVVAAYLIYRGLKSAGVGTFSRTGIATIAALFIGNLVMMGIIILSGIQGSSLTADQTLGGLSLLVAVNMAVAVVEAVVTAFIVTYIERRRPDMLGA
ncbi:MAG: energy-coupling factor ABC transporter permease, partial [Methanoregula sp.]